MAWCHLVISHYLSQCWPISMLPYDVTRPQWFKFIDQFTFCISKLQHFTYITFILIFAISGPVMCISRLVQDCSISIADALEILQSCTKPSTVYPKKYAHGFCFAVLCCGYTLTDFPISIRLTSLALWQSNDCPSTSKATLMNMDKYFMWIHYERLHNHNKAKHNKTVCIFLGIYCISLFVGTLGHDWFRQ